MARNRSCGGILLFYNMVRYQMVQICLSLKGNYLPYQLSFNGSLAHIIRLLVGLHYSTLSAMVESLILPARKERTFPRMVKPRPPNNMLEIKKPLTLSERH